MGGLDYDDWKVNAMEPNDVGKVMDCTSGQKQVMKTSTQTALRVEALFIRESQLTETPVDVRLSRVRAT